MVRKVRKVRKCRFDLGFYCIDNNFLDFIRDDFFEIHSNSIELTHSSDNYEKRQRMYVLYSLLKNVKFQMGDICEVGVFKGQSAFLIASLVQKLTTGRIPTFHIFDSFEGLSQFEREDGLRPKLGKNNMHKCPLNTVKKNLRSFDFIEYYKGWIPSQFHEVEDTSFSFVHIDVDLFHPTYESISFFYPRMIKYGIMAFDDYGSTTWPGARRAIDRYLLDKEDYFFVEHPSGEAFILKL
jgi:hypothetical protein